MTIIYLVRHGQASFSADDYDQLSDKGVEQAELVGEYLKKKISNPVVVITGDMVRHKQTAKKSIEAFEFDKNKGELLNQEDKRWNEYDHQSILATYSTELATPRLVRHFLEKQENPLMHFKSLYIDAINQWTAASETHDYMESFDDFGKRVLAALKQVADNNPKGNVIVYTSGGPISIIVCYLLGMPFTQFINVNLNLVNGGVTKIVTRGKERKLALSTMNEHYIFEQCPDKNLITYT